MRVRRDLSIYGSRWLLLLLIRRLLVADSLIRFWLILLLLWRHWLKLALLILRRRSSVRWVSLDRVLCISRLSLSINSILAKSLLLLRESSRIPICLILSRREILLMLKWMKLIRLVLIVLVLLGIHIVIE